MMHEKSETLLILQLKYGMPRRIRRYIVPLLCRREHRIYLLHIRELGGLQCLLKRNMCSALKITSRPPGEMASRLTTNQEIAGSTPAVVILFFSCY